MNYGSNTHSQRFWRPTRVPKISPVILWAQVGSTQASLPKGRRSAALQHASSGACRKTFHLLQSTLSGRPRRLAPLLRTHQGRRCSDCGGGGAAPRGVVPRSARGALPYCKVGYAGVYPTGTLDDTGQCARRRGATDCRGHENHDGLQCPRWPLAWGQAGIPRQ